MKSFNMQASVVREGMHKRPNANLSGAGPGGYLCPCCGPAPKHRKKTRRAERRRANQKELN